MHPASLHLHGQKQHRLAPSPTTRPQVVQVAHRRLEMSDLTVADRSLSDAILE